MGYRGDNRKSQKRGEGDARGDHFNAVGSHAPSLKDSGKKNYFVLVNAAISSVTSTIRKTDDNRIDEKGYWIGFIYLFFTIPPTRLYMFQKYI